MLRAVRQALIVNPNATRVTPELAVAVDRIYVFGGDGAFNEVVNGIEDADVALGFLPGGGTSVLPRALGLPRDPVEAARRLGRSGRERTISLGRVNGRRFTFSAGVGLDAEVVRRGDALGRLNGRRAGDVALGRTLLGIVARRRGRLQPAMAVLGRDRVAFALVP